ELARVGRPDAHRGRQPVAHRAETARRAPHARVLELVVLRRPHLVLADAGDDKGLAAGRVGDLLDDVLWLDDIVAPFVLEREVVLPLRDLGGPLPPALADGRRRLVLQLLAEGV